MEGDSLYQNRESHANRIYNSNQDLDSQQDINIEDEDNIFLDQELKKNAKMIHSIENLAGLNTPERNPLNNTHLNNSNISGLGENLYSNKPSLRSSNKNDEYI
jgi:hypothetical protein